MRTVWFHMGPEVPSPVTLVARTLEPESAYPGTGNLGRVVVRWDGRFSIEGSEPWMTGFAF